MPLAGLQPPLLSRSLSVGEEGEESEVKEEVDAT